MVVGVALGVACHLEGKRIYDACYRAARTTRCDARRRQTMTKGDRQRETHAQQTQQVCVCVCLCVCGRRRRSRNNKQQLRQWRVTQIKSALTKSIAYFSAGAETRKTHGKHVFIHLYLNCCCCCCCSFCGCYCYCYY